MQARAVEITQDRSYRALCDLLIGLVRERRPPPGRLLDAGCGLGYLTERFVADGYQVVGLDPSTRSIRHATWFFPGLDFRCATLEEEAERSSDRYDVIVANMVLHSVAALGGFLRAARRLLDGQGVLLATLPNPRLYLRTREGVDLRDFAYEKESSHLLPFRIRGREPHPELVWHYHRPVERYAKYLADAGFGAPDLFEPEPVGERDWRDVLVIRAWGY